MRERHVWVIMIILLIIMFTNLATAELLKGIISDPRYILLVVVMLIGLCFTIIAIIRFRERSLAYNIFDSILDVILGLFQFSNLFLFLLGLVLLLSGIYGLIHGPDSIGMQKL